MKLSEAIRLGSMMGPQCFGYMRLGEATCALGAAYKALDDSVREVSMTDIYPWLAKKIICPVDYCSGITEVIFIIAQHLNDDHRWTRERIADWVATVEPKEEIKVVEEKVEELELVSQ